MSFLFFYFSGVIVFIILGYFMNKMGKENLKVKFSDLWVSIGSWFMVVVLIYALVEEYQIFDKIASKVIIFEYLRKIYEGK
jgi:hypothetical protein